MPLMQTQNALHSLADVEPRNPNWRTHGGRTAGWHRPAEMALKRDRTSTMSSRLRVILRAASGPQAPHIPNFRPQSSALLPSCPLCWVCRVANKGEKP